MRSSGGDGRSQRFGRWGGRLPWTLLLLWTALVTAALLALAPFAGAAPQQGEDAGRDPAAPAAAGPPGEAAISQVFAAGEANVIQLGEVDWAGLVWRGPHGVVPAPVLSAEVDIRVTGLVARARLTQRFENPSDDWLEATYLFPLPDDAAVDTLLMRIGDRVIEGQIHEKEEARQIYEQAKSEGKKASLVEQRRPNVFTTRVANVGPHEAVEITIELQQAVRYDSGEMSLRFPTVVNPRHTPAAPSVGEIEAPVLASLDDELPAECDDTTLGVAGTFAGGGRHNGGEALHGEGGHGYAFASTAAAIAGGLLAHPGAPGPPRVPVTFAVDLDAGFRLDYLESPHHPFDVVARGRDRYRVTLGEAPVEADRDFELVWAPQPSSEPRAALFTEEHDGDVYALLMVLPPDDGGGGFVPLDREMIFIVDSSGSMHGASMEQAKTALNAALDGLTPGDSFNVIDFDDTARALFPGSLAATPEAIAKARAWVAGLDADGGTNMLPALAAALEGPGNGYADAGARSLKQVIFLTDGAVGNEEELFDFVRRHVGEARLFTVGIGSAPNAYFMRRAAEEGRGTFTFIGNPQEVALKVEQLTAKLEGTVVADLEVRWDDPTAETWPAKLPDLYAGEPLVVAARAFSVGDRLQITGRRDGSFWQHTVPLADAAAAGGGGPTAGVRQLWARRKIDGLLARLAEGVDPEVVRADVVAVALAHHLVSRYTSLVAVDVTPSRPLDAALGASHVPLPMPAGWTPESMPVGASGWPAQLALGLVLLLAAAVLAAGRRRRPFAARLGGGRSGTASTGGAQ